jgi:hypothetical protein
MSVNFKKESPIPKKTMAVKKTTRKVAKKGRFQSESAGWWCRYFSVFKLKDKDSTPKPWSMETDKEN